MRDTIERSGLEERAGSARTSLIEKEKAWGDKRLGSWLSVRGEGIEGEEEGKKSNGMAERWINGRITTVGGLVGAPFPRGGS